jgi:hypothetical protein
MERGSRTRRDPGRAMASAGGSLRERLVGVVPTQATMTHCRVGKDRTHGTCIAHSCAPRCWRTTGSCGGEPRSIGLRINSGPASSEQAVRGELEVEGPRASHAPSFKGGVGGRLRHARRWWAERHWRGRQARQLWRRRRRRRRRVHWQGAGHPRRRGRHESGACCTRHASVRPHTAAKNTCKCGWEWYPRLRRPERVTERWLCADGGVERKAARGPLASSAVA